MQSAKALFLDRDGVINVNHGYVYREEDCDFVPGIFDLCLAARKRGYTIVIVTNQSGIARNYYSRATYYRFSRWIEHQFWLRGIRIRHTYHCPHHPGQSGPYGIPCTCRKPRPGMLEIARQTFHIAMHQSVMVGDRLSDMKCALQSGISKPVLLAPRRSSYTPKLEAPGKKPYYRATDLSAIIPLL